MLILQGEVRTVFIQQNCYMEKFMVVLVFEQIQNISKNEEISMV